jgi:hypothetical protein
MTLHNVQHKFWQQLLKKSSLRTGLATGGLMNVVMFAALFAANRMPWLESRALERNAISAGAFLVVALIPVFRFYRRPPQLFLSGLIGVALLTLGYITASMYFPMLERMLRTPAEVFIDGCAGYGVTAALLWVAHMCRASYGHAPLPTRRRRPGMHT